MSTVIIPPDELVISPTEMADVEEFLRGLDLTQAEQNLRKFNALEALRLRMGNFSVVRAAGWALVGVVIAWLFSRRLQTETDVLPDAEEERKRRKKTRLHICATALLGILSDAKTELDQGYMFNRGLQTEDGKRKARKFKSRA